MPINAPLYTSYVVKHMEKWYLISFSVKLIERILILYLENRDKKHQIQTKLPPFPDNTLVVKHY